MAVNIPGLLSVLVFYLVILGTGLWASRKAKREEKRCTGNQSEIAMVGGRNLSIGVSVLTTTATWIGGGFLLGTAEVVYLPNKGLFWAIAPIAYSLNLIVAGLFFVKPIHKKTYVTIMDPFQEKYGNVLTNILLIPSVLADIFWVGCILAALGGTMSVILDVSSHVAVIISAAVAILYTLLGGLYSVAYTDVIQLFLIFLGLWICVPFILLSPASVDITYTAFHEVFQAPWLGQLELRHVGVWLDDLLLVTLCGVCYQAFYQRILAIATVTKAQITCYFASVGCLILAVPTILVGAVAASTNWNQTSFGLPTPYEQDKAGMILPIVLQHLCPLYISIMGIGAIAAAVMSSVDSALLSSASLFARNIYKNIIRKNKASEKEILYVVKISILLFGLLGMGLAMSTSSVYILWFVSGDIMYSVVFPQIVAIFFLSEHTNSYGSMMGFGTGILLRCLAGEPLLGIAPAFTLPVCHPEGGGHTHCFPFRTAVMLATLGTIVLASRLASVLFLKGFLPESWDFFKLTQRVTASLRDVDLTEVTENNILNTCQPFLSEDQKKDASQ